MPSSINIITRHVLDDADDVGLPSAVGSVNTQTKPAVFVVKAYFAGPRFLVPCRQQVSLITQNKCTVSRAHKLLCRFRMIMTAQKSLAALRIRGWVAARTRSAIVNQLVVRHGGQVSTWVSGYVATWRSTARALSPTRSIAGLSGIPLGLIVMLALYAMTLRRAASDLGIHAIGSSRLVKA